VRNRATALAVVALIAGVSCSSSGSPKAKAEPTTTSRPARPTTSRPAAPTTDTTTVAPPARPAFATQGCDWITPADLAAAVIPPKGSDSGSWALDVPISELGNPATGGRSVIDSYNQKWRGDMQPGTKLLDAWVCEWSHPSSSPTSGLPDFVRLYFWQWSQALTPQEWRVMLPDSPVLDAGSAKQVATGDVPGLGDWAVAAQTDPRSLMVGHGAITFEVQAAAPHRAAELVPLATKVQAQLAG
jgi:hypothetical protein